jgi:hypothetical protein
MKLVLSLAMLLASTSAFAEGSGDGAPYNGADYDYSQGAAPQYGCREGQRETVLETDNSAGEPISRPVQYVCRSGKFVPVYGAREAAPRVTQCNSGSRAIILETDNSAGEAITQPAHYVCRAGKWVRN